MKALDFIALLMSIIALVVALSVSGCGQTKNELRQCYRMLEIEQINSAVLRAELEKCKK